MDCECTALRSLSAGGSDQFFRAGGVVVVGTDLYTVNGIPPYTASPTSAPTVLPTTTDRPSFAPTLLPSFVPTAAPTSDPTIDTYTPTRSPTRAPTMAPNTADELGNAQLRAMRVRSAIDLHGRGPYVHKCALSASMGPLCCRFHGDPWCPGARVARFTQSVIECALGHSLELYSSLKCHEVLRGYVAALL